jgi:hypothetical protein
MIMEVCDACEYYYKKEDIIVMDNGSCLCIHCHWAEYVYEEDEYEEE